MFLWVLRWPPQNLGSIFFPVFSQCTPSTTVRFLYLPLFTIFFRLREIFEIFFFFFMSFYSFWSFALQIFLKFNFCHIIARARQAACKLMCADCMCSSSRFFWAYLFINDIRGGGGAVPSSFSSSRPKDKETKKKSSSCSSSPD